MSGETFPVPAEKNDDAGHRERVRKLYLREGLDGWEDYAVLELLLFYAIGRRDTKPLAKELLRHFGSLDRVLDAPVETLKEVRGVGENTAVLIKMLPDIARRYMIRKSEPAARLGSIEAAGDYITAQYYGINREQVYLACLDGKSSIVHGEFIGNGTVTLASVQARAIAETALAHRAAGVILAHNHPSGYAIPSEEDQISTLKITTALQAVGVPLIDHIIVAGNDYVSLSQSGFFSRK